MTEKEIKYYLKKVGYKGRNIIEIWYRNPSEAKNQLDNYLPTLGQKIERIIRWKTDEGIKVLGQIRSFIKSKTDLSKITLEQNDKNGYNTPNITIIDFNELKIEGKSINDYMYEKIKHNYSYSGWNDLSGINLSNLTLHNVVIKNALFANANFDNANFDNANFDNANFYNIKFENCNLPNCSFRNCNISSIRIANGSGSFANSNWNGSSVNNVEISSKNFGNNPIYRRVSYFQFLKIALTGKPNNDSNYTNFTTCTLLSDNTNYQFKIHHEYINWYQSSLLKYGKIKSIPNFFRRNVIKMVNFLNALFSMNWFSVSAAFFAASLLIFLFSVIFYYLTTDYYSGMDNYTDSLNFSIQIFTNLGYGDIKPDLSKGSIGNFLVSIESLLGFFWLALIIIVFSKKINK
tara:strand:+ start:72 stop:1283 length:1212 start_codon:yes stop_codon:yes gene_type:complete